MVKTANLFSGWPHSSNSQGDKHIYDKRISYINNSLYIEPLSDDRMLINLDGEYGGDTSNSSQNLKESYWILCKYWWDFWYHHSSRYTDELALEAIAQIQYKKLKIENDPMLNL